jgi:hypothetical protein
MDWVQQQPDLSQLGGKMKKFYSALENGFYSSEIHGDNMPDDVVEITEEKWIKLLEDQGNGKVISSDKNGNPILVLAPEPTVEEMLLFNTNKKTRLLNESSQFISILQDAINFGMATEKEKSSLPEWQKYRVLLSRINLSEKILNWPVAP